MKARALTWQVGEIAAPAARTQDFYADLVGAVQDDNPSAALTGSNRTHEAGGATAKDNHVGARHVARITGLCELLIRDGRSGSSLICSELLTKTIATASFCVLRIGNYCTINSGCDQTPLRKPL